MANAHQTNEARGQGGGHTVRTAAVVIYATLALLVLTIPQSLPNWLRDMEENLVQRLLLQAATGVQAGAQAVALDIPYRRARAAFHTWTGKQDDWASSLSVSVIGAADELQSQRGPHIPEFRKKGPIERGPQEFDA